MSKKSTIEADGCPKFIASAIVNVVVTASLNQPVNFEELRKHGAVSYDSNRYGGRVAYFQTQEMEGKVSIFHSGKMISVGTKSEAQAFKELKLALSFLVERNFVKKVELQPKIQNLVVTADFESFIELEKLSENLKAIYEPEQFPGAILRLENPFKTSILLFASGKVVITGLKSSEQIEPTIQILKQLIESNQ
jgi:transcription initiation factor TFIID TATA-box-binding protein